MGDLWSRIASALAGLHRGRTPPQEKRHAPRFICSCAVSWEAGGNHGEGELREISATGLRLRTDQALLAGRHIRIRLLSEGEPLSPDVAVGTVIYSKSRKGKVDVGVELLHPERISRFSWFHKLRRKGDPGPSPLPSVVPYSVLHVVDSSRPPRRS